MTSRCHRCRRVLPLSAFAAVATVTVKRHLPSGTRVYTYPRPNGVDCWCRECRRASMRAWKSARRIAQAGGL